MNGLKLAEMDSVEMIDVLHYYFEEDLNNVSHEQIEAKSQSRSVIYRTLYGTKYKYGTSESNKNYQTSANGFSEGDLKEFDPLNDVTKPYVPPTDFNEGSPLPFGEVLDAPLSK